MKNSNKAITYQKKNKKKTDNQTNSNNYDK